MMLLLLLVGRLLLAAVFAVAGLTKLANQPGARQAIRDFGLPARSTTPIAMVLPLIELTIAGALIGNGTARWGAIGAVILLVSFLGAVGINLAKGRRPDCNCFGQIHSAAIGPRTMVRNGVLAAIAVLVAWHGWSNAEASIGGWLSSMSRVELASVIGVVVIAILLSMAGTLAANLLKQQSRLLLRIDALMQRDGQHAGGPSAAHVAPARGLPIGSRAPDFKLPQVDDELVTLEALRGEGKPVMLLFTDPACGPCTTLLPEIALWQHQYRSKLTLALISSGAPKQNQAKAAEFELAHVLVQERHEVADAYRYVGTPSAVVVDSNGQIASALAGGADRIRSLLWQTVAGKSALPVLANHASG